MSNVSHIAKYFTFFLKEAAIINQPWEKVFDAIWDLKSWPNLLPHVQHIDVRYDDGLYQEFMMTVLTHNGDTLEVRSVRKRLHSEIDFFQPVPPIFLKHHAGRWIFKALEKDACELTTYHFWNISSVAEKIFPVNENRSTEEQVEHLLRTHTKFALSSWKEILENKP